MKVKATAARVQRVNKHDVRTERVTCVTLLNSGSVINLRGDGVCCSKAQSPVSPT